MTVIYPDSTFSQIIVTLFGTLLVLIVALVYRPNENPSMNRQEAVNEVVVALFCYTLFGFTNLISEMSAVVQIGWVSLGIMTFSVLFNLLVMAFISCYQAKLKCQRSINIRNAKNLMLAKIEARN